MCSGEGRGYVAQRNIEAGRQEERGRPQKRFMDVVKDYMKRVDMTEEDGEMKADDLLWRPVKEITGRRQSNPSSGSVGIS